MALLIVTCVSQVGIAGASAGIRIPEVVSRTAGAMTVSIQPTSQSQLTFGSVLYGTVSNLNTTASTMTATDSNRKSSELEEGAA